MVVRDDLVDGGTKRPVLAQLLPYWREQHFVFPAASEGHGQIALALAARESGKRATLFLAARRQPTPESERAIAAGADVVWVPNGRYPLVQARARAFARECGARYLPPGFAHQDFLEGVAQRARSLRVEPDRVVVTVGSGALCRGLIRAWPGARFTAIKVGMRPDVLNAAVIEAPERYAQAAEQPPPFASAPFQDAKAWRFVPKEPGVLFWNVAG